jgi:hypothetical protein
MKLYLTSVLCFSMVCSNAVAQMERRGGGTHVNMQNRSAPSQSYNNAANRSVNNNRNTNNNANVNRNYNSNVNVNRNVNVNVNNSYHGGGCYNCGGYYHDDGWNWGSFAAGAAVGVATTAAVAAATRPETQTVVVTAPAVGSVVTGLPGGCAAVGAGGTTIYNCSNVYYRPYYQGTSLVYQVVTYP